MSKFILPLWIFSGIGLLLYSFTQVDLSLTLSQVSIWQGIQKSFQYIGYFNRPLSTALFLALIFLMFVLYILTLNLVKRKIFSMKQIWVIVVSLTVILFFSYNAFSYDLFNYIFDAKIFTHYGQNPYEHKALDYPGDPMLSFMHWTHRTYPYGPVWLVLTIPFSFIGLGFFSITFYLFKFIAVASFFLSAIMIKKISERCGINSTYAVAAFTLNPLVIVECLVSAHNDITMIAFALFGILMFLERNYVKSFMGIIFSIFTKYATALIIPAILARGIFKVSLNAFFLILIFSMITAVIFATSRTNFQPWYLLFVLPFASFIQDKYYIHIPVVLISVGSLLQYVPYLFLGNWDPPIPYFLNMIMIASITASVFIVLVVKFLGQRFANNI